MMSHSLWTILRSIALIGGVSYLIFAAVMYVMQTRIVFAPTAMYHQTPESAGLAFDDITLKTPDDISIRGWYVKATSPRAVVLFCHGNAGNIADRIEMLSLLTSIDLDVFMFDYRGYGESGGKPSEKGAYTDAETAWKWLVEERGVPEDNLVIMGRSLGGPIAAWLAVKHPPKALILESTFTSIIDMGRRHYPWLPVLLLSRYRLPTIDYVKKNTRPLLIIHSVVDDLVPYEFGRALFEAAREPKRFLDITGRHNDGYLQSETVYTEGIDDFIREFVEQ